MELYIIRHGQSENNARGDDEFDRVPDPELTEVGKKQAQHVAEFLRDHHNIEELVYTAVDRRHHLNGNLRHEVTHLYTSAMLRALQTAEPIGQALGVDPHVWIDIFEHGGMYDHVQGVDRGLPGLTRDEVLDLFPHYRHDDHLTDKGWYTETRREELEGCILRAGKVAEALRARAQNPATSNDRVAIVSHGTFIDCLLKALMQNPSSQYYHWMYNTSVSRLDFHMSGRIIVRYLNRVNHLPPELVT